MGRGMRIFCNKCSFEKSISLGVGMLYSNNFIFFDYLLQDSPGIISDSELTRMNKIREKHNSETVDFEQALYHCQKCNNLSNKFYVEFAYAKNQEFIIEHLCPKCEIPMDVIASEDVKQKPCPTCGENLQLDRDGFLWD